MKDYMDGIQLKYWLDYQLIVSPYLFMAHLRNQVMDLIILGTTLNQKTISPKMNYRKCVKDIKENSYTDGTFSSSHGVKEKFRWS